MHITRVNLHQPDKSVAVCARTVAHWIFSGLCVFLAGCVIGQMIRQTGPDRSGWPAAMLAIAATISTLISLSRSLPLQNVLLAAALIGLIAALVQTVEVLAGFRFGSDPYSGTLPWWVPLIWIIAILNSRGAARLILRPWRTTPNYGFQLFGLTVVMSLLFALGQEIFSNSIISYRAWGSNQLAWTWHDTPLIRLPGWILLVLLILFVVTPLLINKKPIELPPDYHPLFLWMLLNLVFLAGAITEHVWLAAVLHSGAVAVAGVFALRGRTRQGGIG